MKTTTYPSGIIYFNCTHLVDGVFSLLLDFWFLLCNLGETRWLCKAKGISIFVFISSKKNKEKPSFIVFQVIFIFNIDHLYLN